MTDILLEVKNLKKHFVQNKGFLKGKKSVVKAVDGVDFFIYKGETLGIVGESGCGKSTTGKMIMQLLEPTEGEVFFEGADIVKMPPNDIRHLRKEFQMIFQDPYASLNPGMKVREILREPFIIHGYNRKDIDTKVTELLKVVGLNTYHADRYPHEFSGGQRQRIGIARALALNPKLIVADEPVSALDVSIQSQILNLMKDLQKSFNLTYLFIAHDLSVVEHISDRIAVMYLGNIVELADKQSLYKEPLHPYTQALLSAIPVPNPKVKKERIILKGDIPSPANPPKGCVFHTRCPLVMESCKTIKPQLKEVESNHFVACHLYNK
ncbi:ABC transporter ATP-binding protein [Viridibacillus arvi]|uniref:ABC transporter ATP-binding protein n=1 Tax=Viridibacillus arvi TaxID=263475 RepID=UPI00187BA1B6|nr:dipeptide ABC transporter ATP-binding protein [Viridibacillus sp. JNUCC-6]QOV11005.1 dipeptide ABC transporter ATP-binding protein [Viridibacillus sp. JNUCC-6]